MVTLWRLSVRVCLSHLRCFEFGKELGLSRPLGCSRNARLCWFLLGTLPKFISVHGNVGEGASGSLCQRQTHWSDLAENGRVQVAQVGPLGRVLLCLRLGLRAGVLLAKFFPLLVLYPLTYLSPSLSTLWLHLLLKATETSGPTYIKLGQWAGTRRDLFSEAFCVQFSKLHVQVTPHPWAHTERALQQAFGEDWGSLLFLIPRNPWVRVVWPKCTKHSLALPCWRTDPGDLGTSLSHSCPQEPGQSGCRDSPLRRNGRSL